MTTKQLLAEFEDIIELVEAGIPANPNNPTNKVLRRRLEAYIAGYFRKLADAFPYAQLGKIYSTHVKESLASDTRGILDPLLATFSDDLQFRLNGFAASAYLKGQAEMITWGKTQRGIPIAYEGPPIDQAVKWAEQHGAKLVTQMDQETKRILNRIVSDGIKNKRGIPGLARDIKGGFLDMSKQRANVIARTETAEALEQAFLDNAKAMGVKSKEWVVATPQDCVCVDNDGVIIPIDATFPSGHDKPPAHPNCECALAPSMKPA